MSVRKTVGEQKAILREEQRRLTALNKQQHQVIDNAKRVLAANTERLALNRRELDRLNTADAVLRNAGIK